MTHFIIQPSRAGMYAAYAKIEALEADNKAQALQIASLKQVIAELRNRIVRETKNNRQREARRNADSTQKNIHPRDVSRRANY